MPCSVLEMYVVFGGTCCINLQYIKVIKASSSTLNTEAANSSETSGIFYKIIFYTL
jgi:hypothetical protein